MLGTIGILYCSSEQTHRQTETGSSERQASTMSLTVDFWTLENGSGKTVCGEAAFTSEPVQSCKGHLCS